MPPVKWLINLENVSFIRIWPTKNQKFTVTEKIINTHIRDFIIVTSGVYSALYMICCCPSYKFPKMTP